MEKDGRGWRRRGRPAEEFGEIQKRWDKAIAAATRNYNAAKTVERTNGAKENAAGEGSRFMTWDISQVPQDVSDFVDKALTNRQSNDNITITLASQWDNKAINNLGRSWQGKYTGSERTIDGEYIRHIIKQHGDPITEALRGQLFMDGDAIKIALSKLRNGEGRVVDGTFSKRNMPTVLTQIPINGYTLYAEEPVIYRENTSLQGRTMYMAPTSTTALTQAATKGTGTIPQRRSGGSIHSIDISSRIVNGYLTDKNGIDAELSFVVGKNGSPGSISGLFVMGSDVDAIRKYAIGGRSVSQGKVRITNPFYATMNNPAITATDIEEGTVQDRLKEIKAAGYDAIIMDYKPGDNYMVMVFNEKQVVPTSTQNQTWDNTVETGGNAIEVDTDDGTANMQFSRRSFVASVRLAAPCFL